MFTRAGHDWTGKWTSIAEALGRLPVKQAWLDGEVVAVDESGAVSFQALQNMMRRGKNAQLAYYVFDLVYLDGYDLSATPLVERKRLLRGLLQDLSENGPVL
jgi:bifunctional non-homologous end joining protein LigD